MGPENAYKTLYLTAGTDAHPVGSDMVGSDLRAIQGATETRIAVTSGVGATVLGISEGLQGSSLNAGNFAQAMRRFADITMRPLWRNMAGSLATIVSVPSDAELWYDDRDVPALKDDVKDAATVMTSNMDAVGKAIDKGYTRESAVKAVMAGDLSQLKADPNWTTVQLQPAATVAPAATAPLEPAAPAGNGKAPPGG